jgi:hypothetical protein
VERLIAKENEMLRAMFVWAIALVGLGVVGSGCESAGSSFGSDADADTDSDTDVDTDADTDADSDTDTDTVDPNCDVCDPAAPTADGDGDGLSNCFEIENGTDPCNPDSDGDGYSDFVEWVAGTNPNDGGDNPGVHGDFYFLEPFGAAPDPTQDTLVFATDIQMADVFLLTDTTGSMYGEIDNLKSSLSGTVIPGIQALIPNVWFGVGYFDDYPYGAYGYTPDVPFGLLQIMTDDAAAAQTAVNAMPNCMGSDWAESQVPAMWTTATGGALEGYVAAQTGCPAGFIGYPCFRPGAVPIIVIITDSPFHNGPAGYDSYSGISPAPPDYATTVTALNDIHAKVLPINTAGYADESLTHAQQIATDTGAVTADGPLVILGNADGTGIGSNVVDAVATLSNGVPMDMSVVARDDPSDSVDATVFIDRVVPNTTGGVADPTDPTVICVGGLATADDNADGYADKFVDVLPGTPICFDIIPKQNDTVAPAADPVIYTAYLDVVGDGVTVLDTREVYFLVPPEGVIE